MIDSVIDSENCQTVAFSLFHTIWTGSLIGALALIMNRFRWRSAALQYRANAVALLLLVVCLFSALWYSRNAVSCSLKISRHPFDQSIKVSENNQTESPEATQRPSIPYTPHGDFIPDDQNVAGETRTGLSARSGAVTTERSNKLRELLFIVVTFSYLLGVGLMLARLLPGFHRGWQLKTSMQPIKDPVLVRCLQDQASRMALRAMPVVATCDRIGVPVVTGLFRPVVLLPDSLLSQLTVTQLASIVAHEFGHIRRLDHVVIVLQRLIEAILFFHPTTWYLSRQLSILREDACDDQVLLAGTDPLIYATSLLRVAELQQPDSQELQKLVVAAHQGNMSVLRRRIERILSNQPHEFLPAQPGPALLFIACLLMVVQIAAGSSAIRTNANQELAKEQPVQTLGNLDEVPLRLPVPATPGEITDTDGKRLPDGMIQRFGSRRYRTGATAWQTVMFSQNSEWIWCKGNGLTVIHRDTGFVIPGSQLGLDNRGVPAMDVSTVANRVAVVASSAPIRMADSSELRIDQSLVMFDSNTGIRVDEFHLPSGSQLITNIALSRDARYAATIMYQTVQIWDLKQRQEVRSFRNSSRYHDACFSPDGSQLILVGERGLGDASVIWNFLEDESPKSSPSEKIRGQMAVTFSPDGKYFATGAHGEKGAFHLWDATTGQLQQRFTDPGRSSHPDGGISFTPDGNLLVAPIMNANVIELLNVSTWTSLAKISSPEPRSVNVSPDGKWLAVAGNDQLLRLYDMSNQKQANDPRSPHLRRLEAIEFAADSRLILVDDKGLASGWSLDGNQPQWANELSRRATIPGSVALSQDREFLAVNPIGDTVSVVDVASGMTRLSLRTSPPFGGSRATAFSADGTRLLTWTDDAVLQTWDMGNGQEIASLPINLPGYTSPPQFGNAIPLVCIPAGGGRIFIFYDRKLKAFDATSGQLIREVETPRISRMTPSRDLRWLATVEELPPSEESRAGGTTLPQSVYQLRLRDTETLDVVNEVPSGGGDSGLNCFSCFSDDSTMLALQVTEANRTPHVRIIEMATQKPMAIVPLESRCTCLQLSPDMQKLAVGYPDGTAAVYDLTTFWLTATQK